MESKCASVRVNQEAIGVAMGAMYAYVKLETAGSSIIAVTTQNRSLLSLSQPVKGFSWRQAILTLIGRHLVTAGGIGRSIARGTINAKHA
jgi:hypothetical protein